MRLEKAWLSAELRDRAGRYHARHDPALRGVRLETQRAFEIEVQRMRDQFLQGPLSRLAEPTLGAIVDYVGWFGWCFWCASYLAPPLALTSARDCRRYAAAMLAYCGPRLMDDALDDHRDYKGKRRTTLGTLASALPAVDAASLRCHTMLAGTWVFLYGLERLGRQAGLEAAERTRRLYERNAPAVLVEGLADRPLDWDQYQQLVLQKSVRYDQILYLNIVAPIREPDKSAILEATAQVSRLAQYLNDLGDAGDDARIGQPNLTRWLEDESAVRALLDDELATFTAALEQAPADVADALAASMVETFDAARRLSTHRVKET